MPERRHNFSPVVIGQFPERKLRRTERRLDELLITTAEPVPGASTERQGAGAVSAGAVVARALADQHGRRADYARSPVVTPDAITFLLHDHQASDLRVFGSWNGWAGPGLAAQEVEPGVWQAALPPLPPGTYTYKFLLDGTTWLPDPANPLRAADNFGGWNSQFELR